MRRIVLSFQILLLMPLMIAQLHADEVEKQIEIIRIVGPQAAGSKQAREARDRLFAYGPEILPRLFVAMDTENTVAANWYRTVYERIISRELSSASPKLPIQFLKWYVRDPQRQGRVRRLALALLDKVDPEFGPRVIPTLLDDPEFREDAVAAALQRGEDARKSGKIDVAKKEFKLAFRNARNSAQVTQAANRLKSVGEELSIVEHLGLVTDWFVLGPFDAPEKTGYEKSFPPEKRVDLNAKYTGKSGQTISWKRYRTTDRLGLVNLIRAIAPVKEAVGYAYTELNSETEQDVELRCGADDNLTVWLNGKLIFTRLQWLNGVRLDRFSAPATLKAGKNRLLVKVCQGPQHKNPAVPNNWSLQLRFCDKDGANVGLTSALPAVNKAD